MIDVVLIQLSQVQVPSGDTTAPVVIVTNWAVIGTSWSSYIVTIEHLLHKVSWSELKGVFVSDGHRDELVLFDLDVEDLLPGEFVGEEDLTIGGWTYKVSGEGLKGGVGSRWDHREAIGWGSARDIYG